MLYNIIIIVTFGIQKGNVLLLLFKKNVFISLHSILAYKFTKNIQNCEINADFPHFFRFSLISQKSASRLSELCPLLLPPHR